MILKIPQIGERFLTRRKQVEIVCRNFGPDGIFFRTEDRRFGYYAPLSQFVSTFTEALKK